MASLGDTLLAQASELYSEFSAVVTPYGNQIVQWAMEGHYKDEAKLEEHLSATADFPLASFPPAAAIVLVYLAYVLFGSLFQFLIGPKLDLYPLRFVYNLAQVMLCSYMSVESLLLAYRNGYSWVPCNPFDTANPPVANLLWLFYVSKILDFLDTVFIISKKNWRQLSFLHVYHHSTIFSIYWLNLRVGYDGDIFLTVTLNGLIHSIMYTYYFVSMHTRDIWWKKFLTIMQMVQFIMMVAQAAYMLHVGCKTFPSRVTAMYLGYILSLFFLFLHFFITSNFGKKKDEGDASKKASKNASKNASKKNN